MDITEREARIREVAIKEIEQPTLAITIQYLDANKIEYVDGKPNIVRVDMDDPEEAIVYFAVKDEKFYYPLRVVDTEIGFQPSCIWSEPKIVLYLSSCSETLAVEELAAMTTLTTEVVWRKGDKPYPKAMRTYPNSHIAVETNPEPRTFEYKLNRLLDYLEQDREGVKKLVEQTECGICAKITYFVDDLIAPYIDSIHMKRMADLSLSLTFDLNAEGNPLDCFLPEEREQMKKEKENKFLALLFKKYLVQQR